jgi:hypothetical protein
MAGTKSAQLTSLLDELRDSNMLFGADASYGINSALFHPFFGEYYMGKTTTLPANTIIFADGHLPDWTLNKNNAYTSAQTLKDDAVTAAVHNATTGSAIVVQKTPAQIFQDLSETIENLLKLYNSTIKNDKANVWNNARAQIQKAFKTLEDSYGLDRPVPDVDVAINDYTNSDGTLIELDMSVNARFAYYTGNVRYTYYPAGVKNGIVVLLELIARVSIIDANRPGIENDVLQTLASATTKPIVDATIQPLIDYMSNVVGLTTTPPPPSPAKVPPQPAPAPSPAPTPTPSKDTLAEFLVEPTPAVRKAIENLNLSGRDPTEDELKAIRAAGAHTAHSTRFVVNTDDYKAFMQGYGKITDPIVRGIAQDENATPLRKACAEARLFALGTQGKSAAKRKALAFSQIIL